MDNNGRSNPRWMLSKVHNAVGHVEACKSGFKWELTFLWENLAQGYASTVEEAGAALDEATATLLEWIVVELRKNVAKVKHQNG